MKKAVKTVQTLTEPEARALQHLRTYYPTWRPGSCFFPRDVGPRHAGALRRLAHKGVLEWAGAQGYAVKLTQRAFDLLAEWERIESQLKEGTDAR